MNALRPMEIRRLPSSAIAIVWSDGLRQEIEARVLRTNCPCASCREARGDGSHQAPLSPKKSSLRIVESSIESELSLQQITGVGNYAIALTWADGHSTGIYDWGLLRSLSAPSSEAQAG